MRLILSAYLAVALLSSPSQVVAEASTPALPSSADLSAAAPLLGRGLVAVVEPTSGSNRASMLLLARAEAPASAFYGVLAEPESYPEVMPAMEEVHVTGRRGNAIAYSWLWRAAATPWRGACAMALAPPSDVAVRITRSDLGTGDLRWHFYPQGEGRSVGAAAVTFDLSEGHPLLRWLMGRGTAMPEAVTLIVSAVLLEGSRRGAMGERRAASDRPPPSPPLAAPRGLAASELAGLGPLLSRGAVVLLDMNDQGGLREVVVAESVDAPREAVLRAVQEVERWDDAIPVVERLEVTGRDGGAVDVDIALNLSMLTIRGTARATRRADGIELRGTGGGLRRMWLRMTVADLPGGRTALVTAGRAELAEASFLLRRMISREPLFAHGLNSAAQLLLVRGLAAEARRGR